MKIFLPLLPAFVIFPLGLLAVVHPLQKLLWATVGLLFLLKIGSLIRNWQQALAMPRGIGWILYLFMWPGMRPESFSRRKVLQESVGRDFVEGFVFFVAGASIQLILFFFWETISEEIRLYLGLLSFLVLIHFGFLGLLYSLYRICGWPVEPLFRSPFLSTSLRDFWSKRWNLAFVDMDKRIFLPLFPQGAGKAFAVFGIFVVSGCLHEIGISYPADGGWGAPFLYFIIHGVLTMIEPSIPGLNKFTALRRLWTWVALLVPAPLLFHLPFLRSFVEPYFEFGHQIVNPISFKDLLYWAILACGAGHFLILGASFQVPQKLGWKVEFARLGRFNQKIFWTYGGYIVFCIVAFGFVDLLNSKGLLENHPSSIAIAIFIALFWTARVIIDFLYFKHEDWPKGDAFVIGHACLTALFCFLAITHLSLVAWHLTQQ